MIRSLDPSSETFLTNINRISERMEVAQRRIATGKRVSSVADDPDHISTILQARANLEATGQVQANLGRVKAESDAAEQAVQSSVRLLERARVLGSQGLTGTATADTRRALAGEIGAILEQLVGITRTTVEGRYIFSGDADQQPPYAIDLNQEPAVSNYSGGGVTRFIQHPNGTRFSVARTAQDLFDAPGEGANVFQALNLLRGALSADDEASIATALSSVTTSLNHLNGQLSYYGTVQNKVAEAVDFGSKLQLQIKTHLSLLEDADLTESILDLNLAQVQLQAALKAKASAPRTSLFDYIG
jgi:flagellar hook-associated protein 3 FlgL